MGTSMIIIGLGMIAFIRPLLARTQKVTIVIGREFDISAFRLSILIENTLCISIEADNALSGKMEHHPPNVYFDIELPRQLAGHPRQGIHTFLMCYYLCIR
jgi:hypothetical protein